MTPSFLARAALAATLTVVLSATTQLAVGAPAHASPTSRTSAVAAVKRLSASPTPKISGDGSVGAVLRALPGAWRPGHVSLHYQWFSNGHAVSGATSVRFTVRAADAGKSIRVTVRGSRHGYRTVSRTSKALAIAAGSGKPTNVAISGSGDFRVGSTVAPGTYVTAGSTTLCYWSRVSSFDGRLSSIIANDVGSGQRVITILPSDYGVTFSDCGDWVPVAAAPTAPAIATGIYVVGSQIPAGQYQATASADGCYWATLSGFTGDLTEIIANNNVGSGSVIVDVPADAAGFESSGCGVWTRVG